MASFNSRLIILVVFGLCTCSTWEAMRASGSTAEKSFGFDSITFPTRNFSSYYFLFFSPLAKDDMVVHCTISKHFLQRCFPSFPNFLFFSRSSDFRHYFISLLFFLKITEPKSWFIKKQQTHEFQNSALICIFLLVCFSFDMQETEKDNRWLMMGTKIHGCLVHNFFRIFPFPHLLSHEPNFLKIAPFCFKNINNVIQSEIWLWWHRWYFSIHELIL